MHRHLPLIQGDSYRFPQAVECGAPIRKQFRVTIKIIKGWEGATLGRHIHNSSLLLPILCFQPSTHFLTWPWTISGNSPPLMVALIMALKGNVRFFRDVSPLRESLTRSAKFSLIIDILGTTESGRYWRRGIGLKPWSGAYSELPALTFEGEKRSKKILGT